MVMSSPSFSVTPPAVMVRAAGSTRMRAGAGDAGLAHAARDDGRMRGHAAARGQDAFGGMHAVDVFRAGFHPHQNDLVSVGLQPRGVIRREHDLAGSRARRSRQAGGDDLALGFRIDGRMQQLVERGRLDAADGFFLADQSFIRQLDRDAQRGLGRALAAAGLQHPELALLDGEFEVLHVAVVLLQRLIDARELGEGLRHRLFHRRLVGAGLLARSLGDFLRRADAGDHVLALGIDEEFAVEAASRRSRDCA